MTDTDIFTINVTVSAGNKVAYYSYPDEGGASNISISSTIYPKALFRYRTSDTSIKAKIVLVFSAGTQTILDESSSTTWTTGTADITATKTIDHVRFYANQATGYVYYDFLLLHKGTFSFPYFEDIDLDINNLYVQHQPPRVGSVTQYMGMQAPVITVKGNMDSNTVWGSPDGQYLYQIYRDAYNDPFQWLTSDIANCKVVPTHFNISQKRGMIGWRQYVAELAMYSRSSGTETNWPSLAWFGHT